MNWLLDTNVVSEGVRVRPAQSVMDWLSTCPAESVAISAVTLAELRQGAAAAQDATRRAMFERWIETQILGTISRQVLPVSLDILIDWLSLARMMRARGATREAADLLIASTARVNRLTLVTRNVRDFADTGLVVYDPWHDETHRMDQP